MFRLYLQIFCIIFLAFCWFTRPVQKKAESSFGSGIQNGNFGNNYEYKPIEYKPMKYNIDENNFDVESFDLKYPNLRYLPDEEKENLYNLAESNKRFRLPDPLEQIPLVNVRAPIKPKYQVTGAKPIPIQIDSAEKVRIDSLRRKMEADMIEAKRKKKINQDTLK